MHDETEREDGDPLPRLVMEVAHRMRAARMRAFEPLGLAPHHGRALLTVARGSRDDSEFRLTDLASALRISPRSATDVVDALEERSLVLRRPSPRDRRATTLALTDEGRRVVTAVRTSAEPDDLFSSLSPTERTTLTDLLRHITETTPGETE